MANECLTKVRPAFVSASRAFWFASAAAVALAIVCAVAARDEVSAYLLQRLTYVRPLPESAATANDVVYVLGGTPNSLRAKFRTAAKLLQDGRAARVLVLHQKGLMAFDPDLERNLSADEWVMDNFRTLGVKADAIQFIDIEEKSFGTWSEARGVSRLAEERGYQRMILVTSPFHSRRVWESFSRTIENSDANVFLYLSDESACLRELLTEYAKLLLYRMLLF